MKIVIISIVILTTITTHRTPVQAVVVDAVVEVADEEAHRDLELDVSV